MLNKLLALKNRENSLSEFCSSIRQGIPLAVFGASESFKHYLTSLLDDKVLYIAKDIISAHSVLKAVNEIAGKSAVIIPPKDELLLMTKAFSRDNSYERISALDNINSADVVIVLPETLMQTAPKKLCSLSLEKNGEFMQTDAIKQLIKLGYQRVDTVASVGTFSVRGDIIDIFAINSKNPYRIDFFGDTVEAIKEYDVETRQNLGYLDKIKILQATEFIFADDDVNDFKKTLIKEIESSNKNQKQRRRELLDDIELLLETKAYDRLEVLGVLSKDCATIFDLLPRETVVVFDEPKLINEVANLNYTEFSERYKSLVEGGEVFSFASKNLMDIEGLKAGIKKFRLVAMQTLSTLVPFFNPLKIINPQNSGVADYQLDFKEVFVDIDNWLKSGYSITVCTGDVKRADKFNFELSLKGIASAIETDGDLRGVDIRLQKLEKGFIFHEEKTVVIGSGNLFAKASGSRIKKSKQTFFSAPEVGDYCVHETHGIGRVLGNKKISSTEGTKDYVAVEYYGGDVLYIPVEQMDILTRYLGSDKKPRLSKIGGKDFENVKKRVKESIKKMSFDLKKLYQEREESKGYKFNSDEELEAIFESKFPFEDTPDQIIANQDIKNDMTSGKVMDRLVCGDVGFGKTEVAFRAVFRAIADGKQVAFLAPTTILTEQHYNTAIQRFSDFGIKIAVLNRFKSAREQDKIIQDLKNGDVDLVIGTHRLLSKDVAFKDLGLLVLDEEQRFGVEHKEKIKLLKSNIDAITLTATPIPRTLHMSLSGIRSISTINTPPKKRLPVQTYVCEQTDMLIKDALTREINRGGQAFILYNRVDSIFSFAKSVENLLPNAKLTVVHGQMDEKVMEQSIMKFYHGESDVLISTTIIENGIDLPKANTLIVIDADKLGLSTLYQLKGRVGRSDRLAYAYFTFKREKILSQNAFERLNAIVEFTEMGSGIKIAMRDLEIRGAGNILGAQQHGHMDKIGYELYSKLLREEIEGKEEVVPELDVRLSAFIPDSYIDSNVLKMDAYKEIAEISSLEREVEFRKSIEDAYGILPEETDNLINIAIVKMLGTKLGVKKIVISKDQTSIIMSDFSVFSSEKLQGAMDKFSDSVKIAMSVEPAIEFLKNGQTNADMLKIVRAFLICAVKN